MSLLSSVLDAVVPDACVGCGAPGRALCRGCAAELDRVLPRRRDPTPRPRGLPPVTASGAYAGTLREALLSYKERGRTRLSDPLSRLLAAAVLAALLAGGVDPHGPVTLVAVPSSRSAKRERGHCHVDTLATGAVLALRDAGIPARHLRALRRRGRSRDSVGLSAADRAGNDSEFVVRRRAGRALRGTAVIVVDDIVTTGSTALAVTQALRAAGASVTAVAAVAATSRRLLVKATDEV